MRGMGPLGRGRLVEGGTVAAGMVGVATEVVVTVGCSGDEVVCMALRLVRREVPLEGVAVGLVESWEAAVAVVREVVAQEVEVRVVAEAAAATVVAQLVVEGVAVVRLAAA